MRTIPLVLFTFYPAEFTQSLRKSGDQVAFGRTRAQARKSDGPQLARLLRTRRERPRHRRTADQRDELPAPHSMTSSARESSMGGTSMPSALAVLTLIASSNLVGCWIGRSTGLAPFRIRSMYPADWRKESMGSSL